MVLPAKLAVANSSYLSLDKKVPVNVTEVENWTTIRASVNVPVGFGGTASVDCGVKTKINFTEDEMQLKKYPAFEAKYNQGLYKDEHWGVRAYARYRNSESAGQLRFAAGGSYKVNDILSVYADGHYTLGGIGDGKPGASQKAGLWVGADLQVTPKDCIGWEFCQGNIDIQTGQISLATNLFYKHNF